MARKHLFQEIRDFQNKKKLIVPALLLVGVAGLFLPVLPGVAIIALALLLLFPRRGEEILARLKRAFRFGPK
jgi:uncharacterized membrane protein YbaN (DUF454 family)